MKETNNTHKVENKVIIIIIIIIIISYHITNTAFEKLLKKSSNRLTNTNRG
jgi:hypothetical protein